LRVLHVIPSVAVSDGGPSRAIAVMERALTAGGITVVTATTDHGRSERGPAYEEIAFGNGTITRFYARKLTNFYKAAPGIVPWLWKNAGTFDVVHIHALFSFSSLAAGLIAWLRGVPYVVRPLGTLTFYGMTRRASVKRLSLSLLEGPMLRRAAAVHFTSNQEQAEAEALRIAMRGVIIPLGVEVEPPGAARRFEEEYPIAKGKIAILFLSRLDPKKNPEALLDAIASSADLTAATLLLIAGAGHPAYVDRLKAHACSVGLGERVIWLGHVEGQLKADLLARADIFVLPSLSENFGIAAVEAMLAGLPCVLGEGVAVAKPAAAEGAAFSVTPVPEAIAGAIRSLAADEGLRRQMGDKATEHAARRYSTEAMARALTSLYSRLSDLPCEDAA
jgi:glycosyltransferase involved in cell wall biosynthesis